MWNTLIVTFDGQYLRPELPLNLEPNKRCIIKIESAIESVPDGNAGDVLEAFTGTLEAPNDWSSQHNYYLYGTPKDDSTNLEWIM
ncbi:hypothetical protein [Calothrix sp. PCC 7507]|uniref:hypothetical protein n=1 Tax=Calothrix sp. PCC 7507 TaxID=99598 RepID=UPI00029EF731|nr:hypothetical protein [Calothrix sp. PCC 7507]AFY33032.1 hypothetical protein Cal7507_2611 [Calothrix sp. PCC 7507]